MRALEVAEDHDLISGLDDSIDGHVGVRQARFEGMSHALVLSLGKGAGRHQRDTRRIEQLCRVGDLPGGKELEELLDRLPGLSHGYLLSRRRPIRGTRRL